MGGLFNGGVFGGGNGGLFGGGGPQTGLGGMMRGRSLSGTGVPGEHNYIPGRDPAVSAGMNVWGVEPGLDPAQIVASNVWGPTPPPRPIPGYSRTGTVDMSGMPQERTGPVGGAHQNVKKKK